MLCWRSTPNQAESDEVAPKVDRGRSVALIRVVAHEIGETTGGSQREERLDILDQTIAERGIDKDEYAWYRDLRRNGTVPAPASASASDAPSPASPPSPTSATSSHP